MRTLRNTWYKVKEKGKGNVNNNDNNIY